MNEYHYRLLNVFAIAGDRLSGNPLCVFEAARDLDERTMQALARQFNLSETTFILPSTRATARVRIFTPAFELPFAGHPTLGTAHIVRQLSGRAQCEITLETAAGVIPVSADGDRWTLQANAPTSRPLAASRSQLAEMLSLTPDDIAATPLWVNTGTEHLVVPLTSADAVQRCAPLLSLLGEHARVNAHRHLVYVWASAGGDNIRARFFFSKGNALAEDPATGSACANLGGWFIATGASLPLRRRVHQGDQVGRPSLLGLSVDERRRIYVSGEVIELGDGLVRL